MRVAANIFWLGGKGSWSTRLREKRGKLPQPRGLVFRRSNPARPEPYQLRRANLLSESQMRAMPPAPMYAFLLLLPGLAAADRFAGASACAVCHPAQFET